MKQHLRRRDSEALIDGRPAPGGDEELADVDAFLTTLREDFGSLPAPAPRPVLASILDGRRPLRTVDPVVAPASRPASLLSWSRWPRPVAAVLATGTLLFGGLATAGALPAPLQRVSADVGDQLGVHLPRPADATRTPHRISPASGPTGTRAPGTPRGGAGRTGTGASGSSSNGSTTTTPSLTDPVTGASGSVPTLPTVPTLPLPGARPLPSTPGLPPSTAALPNPLGVDADGLLHDLPNVSRVAPSP